MCEWQAGESGWEEKRRQQWLGAEELLGITLFMLLP